MIDEITGQKTFGKSYIGQSVDIEERFREHKRATEYSRVSLISRVIKKYGVENFEFRILLECDKNGDILDKFEIDAIKSYNTIHPNGYNIKSGGSQYTPPTEEQIKLLSEKNKGENNPMWGHSEERMGEKNPMFNRQHTEAAIREIAARSHRGNHPNARKVADNLGNIWDCVKSFQ